VAYGKILFELKRYAQASEVFTRATELKSDNILAHKLNALSLIKMNKYPQALAAYKYVLYLNPQDAQAQKFVANWEYLEAPGYSPETFAAEPGPDHELIADSDPRHVTVFIEALIARNEVDRARSITKTSLEIWPDYPGLLKQLKVINESLREDINDRAKTELQQLKIKKDFLVGLLRRIELRSR
jgi:tetratricopeptide (TPR) repeat protein